MTGGAHGRGNVRFFGRGLREMGDGTVEGQAAAEVVGEVILMIRQFLMG